MCVEISKRDDDSNLSKQEKNNNNNTKANKSLNKFKSR